jgi:N-carbamoyl-L-amino-acid hydrolase
MVASCGGSDGGGRACPHRGGLCAAGGAPKWSRPDALAALAHIIARISAAWNRLDARGHRLVATLGIIGVDPAMATWSRVSAEARFSLAIRNVDIPALEEMRRVLDVLVAAAERAHGVTVTRGFDTGPRPRVHDDALVQRLRHCAAARGIATHEMPSGVGHDARALHEAGLPAAMLFIRNQNGSHNPDEAMEMADFAQAARILATLAATH